MIRAQAESAQYRQWRESSFDRGYSHRHGSVSPTLAVDVTDVYVTDDLKPNACEQMSIKTYKFPPTSQIQQYHHNQSHHIHIHSPKSILKLITAPAFTMQFSTFIAAALVGASATMAVPAYKRSVLCPGLPGTPECCAVNALGVADLDCAPRTSNSLLHIHPYLAPRF